MDEFGDLLAEIKKFAGGLDKFILSYLNGRYEKIWKAARHYIEAGGKRLRPFIIFTVYNLFKRDNLYGVNGFNPDFIYPAAGSVELIHTFSLVHDDIMDKDDIRRGVMTVHKKWGEAIGILAGDLLFAAAFDMMNSIKLISTPRSEAADSDTSRISGITVKDPYRTLTELNRTLGRVSIDLCEGQVMDMDFETNDYVRPGYIDDFIDNESEKTSKEIIMADYMGMISLKTAALFKACCRIGALLADADDDGMQQILNYGFNLGMAFQIIDDILGIKADEKKLGKSVGLDIKDAKKTYLLIYAYNHLKGSDLDELKSIMNKESRNDSDVERVIELFEKAGAVKNAQLVAEQYIQKSLDALEKLKETHRDISDNAFALLKQLALFNKVRIY